jgi:hypothetical protein
VRLVKDKGEVVTIPASAVTEISSGVNDGVRRYDVLFFQGICDPNLGPPFVVNDYTGCAHDHNRKSGNRKTSELHDFLWLGLPAVFCSQWVTQSPWQV